MSARRFLDTNVLVYTDDHDNPNKQATALELVESGYASGDIAISTQVLIEYFAAATKGRRVPIHVASAKLQLFSRFEVLRVEVDDLIHAADIHGRHHISWWDALIVQVALRAGCTELLTEDLQDGRRFGALLVRNPFKVA